MAGGGPKKPQGVRTYDATNWEDYKVELKRWTATLDAPIWAIITGAKLRPEPAHEDDDNDVQQQRNNSVAAVGVCNSS